GLPERRRWSSRDAQSRARTAWRRRRTDRSISARVRRAKSGVSSTEASKGAAEREALAERNPQIWSAEGYAQHAAFVPALGAPLVDRLNPQPGERILDVGCGDGTLTAQIAARGAAVVGIDASESMI